MRLWQAVTKVQLSYQLVLKTQVTSPHLSRVNRRKNGGKCHVRLTTALKNAADKATHGDPNGEYSHPPPPQVWA